MFLADVEELDVDLAADRWLRPACEIANSLFGASESRKIIVKSSAPNGQRKMPSEIGLSSF